MFSALNRFIARLDGDSPGAHEEAHGGGVGFGFQVLRNTNRALPQIEPWFDFIVGINGRVIDDSDPMLFAQEVRNCAGGTVALGLWSAKGQRTRTLHVSVAADAATDTISTTSAAPLGLTLQWTPLAVVSNIWHVLDVQPRSPAELAGLLPYSDYILGTPEGVLHGESGFGELVEDNIGQPLRLWVYNHEYNVTRDVFIQPSRDWGGEGALGCVLGYGALHRLPAPLNEPVSGPGETLFDGSVTEGSITERPADAVVPPSAADSFVIPAQLALATPATPATPTTTTTRKKKERHHHLPAAAGLSMDDYFREEEERSQQLEGGSTDTSVTPVAPPPKAKAAEPEGPPRASTPASTPASTLASTASDE